MQPCMVLPTYACCIALVPPDVYTVQNSLMYEHLILLIRKKSWGNSDCRSTVSAACRVPVFILCTCPKAVGTQCLLACLLFRHQYQSKTVTPLQYGSPPSPLLAGCSAGTTRDPASKRRGNQHQRPIRRATWLLQAGRAADSPVIDTRHYHFMSGDRALVILKSGEKGGQYLGDSCSKPLHGRGTCYHVLAPLWAVSGTP